MREDVGRVVGVALTIAGEGVEPERHEIRRYGDASAAGSRVIVGCPHYV